MKILINEFCLQPLLLRQFALDLRTTPGIPQKIRPARSFQSEFETACMQVGLDPAKFMREEQGVFWVYEVMHPGLNRIHFDRQSFHGIINLNPEPSNSLSVNFWKCKESGENRVSKSWLGRQSDFVKVQERLANKENWALCETVEVPFNSLYIFDSRSFHSVQHRGQAVNVSQHYEFFQGVV